jgi:blue copper oxidase
MCRRRWTDIHGTLCPQVYAGLAGLFVVSDEEEAGLGLPSGRFDIPIVLQDRTFDSNNRLFYSGGFMMEAMTGFLGNRVLINGKADHTLSVDRSVYRIRVLNGSNARIYKLAWGNETPLTVIDTDGGLLEEPVTKPYVMCWDLENVSMRNYLVEKSN